MVKSIVTEAMGDEPFKGGVETIGSEEDTTIEGIWIRDEETGSWEGIVTVVGTVIETTGGVSFKEGTTALRSEGDDFFNEMFSCVEGTIETSCSELGSLKRKV